MTNHYVVVIYALRSNIQRCNRKPAGARWHVQAENSLNHCHDSLTELYYQIIFLQIDITKI